MITRRSAAALAAATLTTVSLCTAPAALATGLQNAGSSCYMTEVISDYEADFQCDFAWSGGTAPYTVSASTPSWYTYISTQVNGESATVYGECRPGRYVLIRITVSDATGSSISDQREFTCTGW